jgi:hypothetical protein
VTASERRSLLVDVTAVIALKAALGAFVCLSGFSHVSDDDYARTVIAEQFAHAPRLDPSGTSWLPLPFWLTGALMGIAGASLETARVVTFVLGVATVAAPYAALRAIRVERAASLAATLVAMALPWNAWLGVATVPEGWSAAIAAAAVIAMGRAEAAPWCGAGLLAASWSRYEAWPACAVFAAVSVARGARPTTPNERRRRTILCGAVALAGPLSWMAWNAYAHGSPVHFLARVSAFRRAIGAAAVPLADKVLGYPQALLLETPEAALLGLAGGAGVARSPALRARWALPCATALAILGFLVAGDLQDGAPTHHPERALAIVWWIFVAMGADAIASAWRATTASSAALSKGLHVTAGAVMTAWCASLPARWSDGPGRSDWDRREPQIARGADMRARHVEHAVVTPCSFEHFALLAAWGEPERARVEPRTNTPPTAQCPRVEER